jgi:hypothetical protein
LTPQIPGEWVGSSALLKVTDRTKLLVDLAWVKA